MMKNMCLCSKMKCIQRPKRTATHSAPMKRRQAVHILLYETHLPAEAILGAFAILDKASNSAQAAHSTGSESCAYLDTLRSAGLMALKHEHAFCNLMAAAFVAYKVYTTNCMPTMKDFLENMLPDFKPRVQALQSQIKLAEQRVLSAISWTVPTRTRFELVLRLLAQMAEHTCVECASQDCTICNSTVDNPYKLPCGHTCCRGCVATMACHGFGRKHACPACCKGLQLLAYHHYSALRTLMPLKLEIDRACVYSVLAEPIDDDELFARAVLWAAVYLLNERKVPVRLPNWLPLLYDAEKNCPQHKVVMAGMDIATAYAHGKPGTLQRTNVTVPLPMSRKRKFVAVV